MSHWIAGQTEINKDFGNPSQTRRKSMSKPAAIITTLEDSAPWLDQRLVLAYLRSTYRILTPLFDLRIGQHHSTFDQWLANAGADGSAFLTKKIQKTTVRTCNFAGPRIIGL